MLDSFDHITFNCLKIAVLALKVQEISFTQRYMYYGRHCVTLLNVFVLLLYVPSQQLWLLRDGQFT